MKKYTEVQAIKSISHIAELAEKSALIYVSAWKKQKAVSSKFIQCMKESTVLEMIDKGQLMHVVKNESVFSASNTGRTTTNKQFKKSLQEVSKERKAKDLKESLSKASKEGRILTTNGEVEFIKKPQIGVTAKEETIELNINDDLSSLSDISMKAKKEEFNKAINEHIEQVEKKPPTYHSNGLGRDNKPYLKFDGNQSFTVDEANEIIKEGQRKPAELRMVQKVLELDIQLAKRVYLR